jgi:predicted nucleic acid-binding protein
MISTFCVVFDANVFFGARLRSLVIELAQTGIFRARWTTEINDEWSRNVAAKKGIHPSKLARTISDMESAVPDCLVEGYEPLIQSLIYTQAKDRHVLAAAIACGASAIVTFNLDDFSTDELARYGIHALHPDQFFLDIEDISSNQFLSAVKNDISHYVTPPLTVEQYLHDLEKAGVPKIAEYLRGREVLLRAAIKT